MAKTLPGYTRYPGDYLMEVVSTCSLAAQGLWVRLEDLMHATERYGYLQHLGRPMPDLMIARRIGITVDEYTATLKELEDVGWITREPRTKVICSEALIAQDIKRGGDRERKHKSRLSTSTSDLCAPFEHSTSTFEGNSEVGADSRDSDNSKDSLNHGHNSVTKMSHAPNGKGKGEGEGTRSTCTFPEGQPPTREGPTLTELPPAVPPDAVASQQAAALARPPDAEWNQAALIEEIAIASPAGVANSWTPLSLQTQTLATSPIVGAVILESREQGIPEREAALWLLRQVRQVTEAVMHEPGWKRFWTPKRMVGFYGSTEYRDLEKFTHGGSGNGNGNSTGRRGRVDGNAEALRRVLGEEHAAPEGVGTGIDEPGGHAQGGHLEAGSARGVHRHDGGLGPAAVPPRISGELRAKPVLSQPSRAQSLRWPS